MVRLVARGTVVVLLAVLAGCTTAPAENEADRPPGSSRPSTKPTSRPTKKPVASPRQRTVTRLLARATIVDRRPFVPGYDRSCNPGACQFGTPWTDASSAPDGRNGCSTRDDVLREAVRKLEMRRDDPCRVYDGTFTDPYSGRTLTYRGNQWRIQIDHLVPLATAWHAGASRWARGRRVQFANDTKRELVAVLGTANQQKQGYSPDRWLPANKAYRCTYVTRYLRVVADYGLVVPHSDAAAIRRVALTRC